MSSELRESIGVMSDKDLVEQYTRRREEYTDEALAMMREEITSRGFDDPLVSAIEGPEGERGATQPSARHFAPDEFVALDQPFSRTDLLIAHAMLLDEKVPFFVDSANSTDILPLETDSSPHFTIHVHQAHLDRARQLIDTHFHSSEGRYTTKYSSTRDRLKAFGFHEVRFSEQEMEETVETAFSDDERKAILANVNRLANEADTVEERIGRMLFYFDNLSVVAAKLGPNSSEEFTREDLLAILETLQIYCDEQDFPVALDSVADTLLGFVVV